MDKRIIKPNTHQNQRSGRASAIAVLTPLPEALERLPADAWHALPPEKVLAQLGSTREGLTVNEAQVRLEHYGENILPRAQGDSILTLLWRQLNNPLIYVLLASTVVAIALGKVIDGLVVFGAVVLNTLIGFVQEYRAGKAIEALSDMVPETATVVRAGKRQNLPAAVLVPGDVVTLQSGDKVPADMRLLERRNLRVEEAALTGESVPAEKVLEPVALSAGIGDRRSMIYSGTLVTSGTALAVVIATGGKTELGRISAMLNETTELETPLTQGLAKVGTTLTVAILLVAALLFGVGLYRGYDLADAALAAIILAVGAIPEGLPAIVTIALAIGVQRMARRRAIIRNLPAVETLGSTTVICSDKTGTLTRNEMTVQVLWTPGGSYHLSGTGYAPEGVLSDAEGASLTAPRSLRHLLVAGVMCNDATLEPTAQGWHVTGDPTEAALLVSARKSGLEPDDLTARFSRLDAIPFESEQQFMATLNRLPEERRLIFLKGAPEAILRRCHNVDKGRVLEEVEGLAREGMRVLAFAEKSVPATQSELREADAESGFTLLGLQGMIDPPRPEAIQAIATCKEAGIVVKMITGDHRATAQAIGHQLGLQGEAVEGAELERTSDSDLRTLVLSRDIFARVAPEHKLRLVRALQAEGHIVAMTGDGVNDAPALKQANIGVAMGITGTAVSKESADVVLTDDNFASIAAAVEEGRRVYDNLVKALAFVLPANLGLAVIFIVAVAFFPVVAGVALLPMQPTQILWINMVASAALGLALAFEGLEPNVMRRSPRNPNAPILSRFVIVRTALVALLMAAGAITLFLVAYDRYLDAGASPEAALREAQTMAVTTVIFFQCFYLLNCRSLRSSIFSVGLFSNPWIFAAIGLVLFLHAGFVYLPFMNSLFGSAPLDALGWLLASLVGLIILPVITLEKAWRNRQSRRALSSS